MRMKVLETKKIYCGCCCSFHDVQVVKIRDKAMFKGLEFEYDTICVYCDVDETFYLDGEQINEDDYRMKDAYRKKVGLLTSKDIKAIRKKYGITQSALCIILGWGEKTITRYETCQVQDRAHDLILKKIDMDPEWFLILLEDAKERLPEKVYEHSLGITKKLCVKYRKATLERLLKEAM